MSDPGSIARFAAEISGLKTQLAACQAELATKAGSDDAAKAQIAALTAMVAGGQHREAQTAAQHQAALAAAHEDIATARAAAAKAEADRVALSAKFDSLHGAPSDTEGVSIVTRYRADADNTEHETLAAVRAHMARAALDSAQKALREDVQIPHDAALATMVALRRAAGPAAAKPRGLGKLIGVVSAALLLAVAPAYADTKITGPVTFADSVVAADGKVNVAGKDGANVTLPDFRNALGLGATQSPTFAGMLLNGIAYTSYLQSQGPYINYIFNDTNMTVTTGGLVRLLGNAGSYIWQINTAAGADFGTTIDAYSIAATGITLGVPIVTKGYTIATLPAGVTGARAHVTNQLTACAAIGAALTAGGALTCPVFYNGAAWVGG